MAPKAILFDLDGTLTDSGEGIIKSVRFALSKYGIDNPDEAVLRTVVGPPLDDSFARLGIPADKIPECIEVYRSRYVPIGRFENHPYPGIQELLEKLNEDGQKLYVATSKPEWMAIEILDHFDLSKYFEMICGATSDLCRNSKEAVIEHLLEQCGTQENAIMVGDTVYDVVGAKHHGIPTIVVSWGYGDRNAMLEAGAIAVANSTDELYELLR